MLPGEPDPAADVVPARGFAFFGDERRASRQAATLFAVTVVGMGVTFIGTAYAARTLGPAKLGASAIVQATVAQVALLFNFGFDFVASRSTTASPASFPSLARDVTGTRVATASALAIAWTLVITLCVPRPMQFVWMSGGVLLLIAALEPRWAFQGLQRLPTYGVISAVGALATTITYVVVLHRDSPTGSDLWILACGGLLASTVAWRRLYVTHDRPALSLPSVPGVVSLLRESSLFWVLAVAVFAYSGLHVWLVGVLLQPRDAGVFKACVGFAAAVEAGYGSINSVLLPRFVEWARLGPRDLWERQKRVALALVPVVALASAFLYVVAPLVYSLLLGPEFEQGIPCLRVLVVARGVVCLGQVFAFGLVAVASDRAFLATSTSAALVGVTLGLLTIPRWGLMGASVSVLVSESVILGLSALAMRQHCEVGTKTGERMA